MKKYAIMALSALVTVGICLATDYTPTSKESATTYSGAKTFNTLIIDGTVTLTGTSQNVTNGQAITVSKGAYVLNGIGQANDSTNTITIAAPGPGAADRLVVLMVATASTNLVTIADSSPVAASGAILMDGNDSAVLMAVDASTWVLLCESDN